jgi:tRNA 2-thiouridine synthesizing protein A
MNQHILDVRGQMCPIPVIRTQNKVKSLKNGDQLVVLCTDPGATSDIPAWCRIHGHEVVTTDQQENEIKITIKVTH